MTTAFTHWLTRELRRGGAPNADSTTASVVAHLRRYTTVADLLHGGRDPLVALLAAAGAQGAHALADDIVDQYHLSDLADAPAADARQNESVDSGLPPSPDTGRPRAAYHDAFPPLSTGVSTPTDDDVFTDDAVTPPPRRAAPARTSTRTLVDSFDGTPPQFIVPKAAGVAVPVRGSVPANVGLGFYCPPPPMVLAQMRRRQRANTVHEAACANDASGRQRQASWCESQTQFCVPHLSAHAEHGAPAGLGATSNSGLDEMLYDRRHFAPIRSGSMSWAYTGHASARTAATQRPRAQRASATTPADHLCTASASIWSSALPEECAKPTMGARACADDDDDDQLLMFVGGLASHAPLRADE